MRQRPNTFITTIIGLLLYLLTIVAEVISIAIRFWIGYTVGQAVIPSTAPPLAQALPFFVIGPIFAFAPVVWGIIALLGLPSGGILTRYELDGRAPTAAEREIVEGALTELMTVQPGIRRPRKWFMSNTIEPDTLVIRNNFVHQI